MTTGGVGTLLAGEGSLTGSGDGIGVPAARLLILN